MNAFDTINSTIHDMRLQEKQLQQQYISALQKVEEEIRKMFEAMRNGPDLHEAPDTPVSER